MAEAYIGLGSNLGDRAALLADALRRMAALGLAVKKVSGFISSAPYGPVAQPDFLNAACLLATTLPPPELLQTLKKLEQDMGRLTTERWGPRCIDLDILLYDSVILNTSQLTLPHPDMLNRRFVLLPLIELAGGGLLHPVSGKSLAWHLARLETKNEVLS